MFVSVKRLRNGNIVLVLAHFATTYSYIFLYVQQRAGFLTELPQWHFHGHAKEKNEWPYGKGKREGNNKNGIVIAINHVTNEFFSILKI